MLTVRSAPRGDGRALTCIKPISPMHGMAAKGRGTVGKGSPAPRICANRTGRRRRAPDVRELDGGARRACPSRRAVSLTCVNPPGGRQKRRGADRVRLLRHGGGSARPGDGHRANPGLREARQMLPHPPERPRDRQNRAHDGRIGEEPRRRAVAEKAAAERAVGRMRRHQAAGRSPRVARGDGQCVRRDLARPDRRCAPRRTRGEEPLHRRDMEIEHPAVGGKRVLHAHDYVDTGPAGELPPIPSLARREDVAEAERLDPGHGIVFMHFRGQPVHRIRRFLVGTYRKIVGPDRERRRVGPEREIPAHA